MKTNKNKIKSLLGIICVIIVFIIGGILAYLTDTDRKVNNFIIGDVDIVLHENNWVPTVDTDNDGVPDAVITGGGENVPKDPSVENIGKNPAYIYLKVSVPVGTVEDGLITMENSSIFEYEIDDTNWTELLDARAYDDETNSNVYVYYYNTALPAPTDNNPSVTTNLFDTINLKDGVIADSMGTEPKSVIIDAYAIQSTGLPQGTTVENTEWANQFIEFAGNHAQTNIQTNLISIEDCEAAVENEEMLVGEEQLITITKPENTEENIEPVTYSSSNLTVATVDSNGKILAGARGTSTITITGVKSGKTINIEITVKKAGLEVSELATSELGDYVNLGTNLVNKNVTLLDGKKPLTDWRVFYKTEQGTWLILSDYLLQSKLPENVALIQGKELYNVYSTSPTDLVNALNDTEKWKELIYSNQTLYNNNSVIVKGGFSREEWEASWYLNTGYGAPGTVDDALYYSHLGNGDGPCQGYWLASVATEDSSVANRAMQDETLNRWYANADVHGVRPAVFIPASLYE